MPRVVGFGGTWREPHQWLSGIDLPTRHRHADHVTNSLPDGLVLRAAEPTDIDQVVALLVERGDPEDGVDLRLVVEDAGTACCAVVVDDDRVVSTATLLDETVVLGGVPIPAGQVELVATDREYEGRGLVRALMGWAHERSSDRGHLAQVMIGIPYFYRQFGYQYAITLPTDRSVQAVPPAPDGHTARLAGPADIPAMAGLQDAAQQAYDLRMPHSPECWRWLVTREGSSQVVVERAGAVVATGRITDPDDEMRLGEIAATDPIAARALLAHAAGLVGTGELMIKERPGSLAGDVLEEFLAPATEALSYYARVPDVSRLLDHLRPVLSARLVAAGLTDGTGEAVVSFFRHHVRLGYADGSVETVSAGGPMQSPGSVGGAGVAPDQVAPLLFGPHGIAGLAERHPDVYPGPNADLVLALFPPVTADLLTFYLP